MIFSLEKDCTACGGTGKETSDALRAALESVRQLTLMGTVVTHISMEKVVRTAVAEFVRVSEHEADQGEIPPPTVRRTWLADDPEPGPEVVAVKDCDGDIWPRASHGWLIPGFSSTAADWDVVATYEPLEDWTHEVD